MKTSYSLVCGLLAAASVPSVHAADLTGSIALGYNSIYEFRGVDLGSDMVEASASVGTNLNGFGLSATAWYATVNDPGHIPGISTSNELDLTLAASKAFGPVTLTGGYIYYDFFEATSTNTQEFYLGASMEFYAGITGAATAYYDSDNNTGWYFDFNVSKAFEISSCLKVVATTGVGLAEDHDLQLKANGDTLNGYQNWYVMLSMPWVAREKLTIAPYIRYVDANSKLVSDYLGQATGQDHFLAGIKLTLEF